MTPHAQRCIDLIDELTTELDALIAERDDLEEKFELSLDEFSNLLDDRDALLDTIAELTGKKGNGQS